MSCLLPTQTHTTHTNQANIHSLNNYFTFKAHSHLKVYSITVWVKTKINFCPSLSIIEKEIKAILLLHSLHLNIYLLGWNCYEVQYTMQLLQRPQEFGHMQCKQAITGRVFSGNLQQQLFVSVQRLQRVWCLSARAGKWQQARKSWFLT